MVASGSGPPTSRFARAIARSGERRGVRVGVHPFEARVALEPGGLSARVAAGQRLRLGNGLRLGQRAGELPEGLCVADGSSCRDAVLQPALSKLCDLVDQTLPPHPLDTRIEP